MSRIIDTITTEIYGETVTYRLVVFGVGAPIAIGPYAMLDGLDLEGLDMSGWDLRSVYLRGASAVLAKFNDTNLRGAHLEGINASYASLEDADLCGAVASDANFTGAVAPRIKLAGATLTGSTWLSADVDEDAFRECESTKHMIRRYAEIGLEDLDARIAKVRASEIVPPVPVGAQEQVRAHLAASVAASSGAVFFAELDTRQKAALVELGDAATFERYLDVQSRFTSFSPRNATLVTLQRPSAVMLRDYDAWAKIGRHVKKDEAAVRIRVPVLDEGSGDTRDPERAVKRTRYVPLFDLEQTQGRPVSAPTEIPTQQLRERLGAERYGEDADGREAIVAIAAAVGAAVDPQGPNRDWTIEVGTYIAARALKIDGARTPTALVATVDERLTSLGTAQRAANDVVRRARGDAPPLPRLRPDLSPEAHVGPETVRDLVGPELGRSL
jgi:hypothetical protein